MRFVCFIIILVLPLGELWGDEQPWSFAPLNPTELPEITTSGWPQNRIDHFILEKIDDAELEPSAPADDRTRIRRLYFNLTGLPPSPEQFAQAIEKDHSELVDELLASPHYGERWARHWLDLARYTDVTASWLKMENSAWRYRDWVIQAFNDDLAYDQFVIRQLATDLLEETPPTDNAALGFLGLSPAYWKELQLPPEIIKTTVADEWEEHMDALGRTFLGLTLGCARCHDHKTEPISAEDYYAIAGVFASIQVRDVPTIPAEKYQPVAEAKKKVAAIEARKTALKKKKPRPEDYQNQLAELDKSIARIKAETPHYDSIMVNGVVEAALYVRGKEGGVHGTKLDYIAGQARDLEMQHRGNPNNTGEIVSRRFLSAFPSQNNQPRSLTNGSGRLDLAHALVEDAQPLAARVIVNRVWAWHFGQGIVATPSNFGFAGEKPTHPELLDDLAYRFVKNGWSIKWLHREILNSATWRQTSFSPESEKHDPENQLFSRMNRRRLEIEAWRDAILFASGELNLEVGGPAFDLKNINEGRRTIYGKIHRRDLDKMLQVHDFPDPAAHSPKRTETDSPLQVLFALNGPLVTTQARKLAERVEASSDPVGEAYSLLYQRKPTERDRKLAATYLGNHGEEGWALYAQALLASNEFLYLD